jgi:hypothetical protein
LLDKEDSVRLGYALCKSVNQGSIGQYYETTLQVSVDAQATRTDELKTGLRQWGLAMLAAERSQDGWYVALLVELDDAGRFETYDPIHVEDIVWCYETEYVPAI